MNELTRKERESNKRNDGLRVKTNKYGHYLIVSFTNILFLHCKPLSSSGYLHLLAIDSHIKPSVEASLRSQAFNWSILRL